MARFSFNLRTAPARDAGFGPVSQRTLAALKLDRTASSDDEPPQGPGWFDSSFDLVRGLDVREAPSPDLQLNEWLDTCLRGGLALNATRVEHVPDAFSGFELEGLALV